MSGEPIGLVTSAASEKLLAGRRTERVPTPWGEAAVELGTIGGRDAAVVLRYGPKLTTPSHKINYRANVFALRALGVRRVISQNAIGSVNPAIRPGDIVVSHDVLDRTKSRPLSMFDEEECWVRVDMTHPFCPDLRKVLIEAACAHSDRVIERGVFCCTEGPRFETPAEIRALQIEGGDIVGTPVVPEVVFTREVEMCFASLAPVINFGAGMAPAVTHFGPGSMNDLYYTAGLHDLVETILADAFKAMPASFGCACGRALEHGFHGTRPKWLSTMPA